MFAKLSTFGHTREEAIGQVVALIHSTGALVFRAFLAAHPQAELILKTAARAGIRGDPESAKGRPRRACGRFRRR